MCDLAYVLLLEQWERQFLAAYQAAVAGGAEPPKWHEVQARLDAALVAEPKVLAAVDGDQMELRQALGVA